MLFCGLCSSLSEPSWAVRTRLPFAMRASFIVGAAVRATGALLRAAPAPGVYSCARSGFGWVRGALLAAPRVFGVDGADAVGFSSLPRCEWKRSRKERD